MFWLIYENVELLSTTLRSVRMFILALPKTNQKASAPFDLTPSPLQRERDPQPLCRLKVTNGLSPRPFPRRLHRTGARLRH
ncbi:MAG: hypothetical protein LBQ74_21030 [Prevotella sp.]|nr:hypothetical protein [Prevotella sp.]